jgi:hypothetical protein
VSLLKQLAESQPSLLSIVKDLYNRHKTKRRRLSLEEILSTLHSVAAKYSRLFIIIDALDECKASSDCRRRFLSKILNLQAKVGANVFATSRLIPGIEKEFNGCLSHEIRASKEDI